MRSKYIYLIYRRNGGLAPVLVSAHTVKHEAHTWMKKHLEELNKVRLDTQQATLDDYRLFRISDGVAADKAKSFVPWEPELFDADHLTRASSQVADWPDWAKRGFGPSQSPYDASRRRH